MSITDSLSSPDSLSSTNSLTPTVSRYMIGEVNIDECLKKYQYNNVREKIYVFQNKAGIATPYTKSQLKNPNHFSIFCFYRNSTSVLFYLERNWLDLTGTCPYKRVYVDLEDIDDLIQEGKLLYHDDGVSLDI